MNFNIDETGAIDTETAEYAAQCWHEAAIRAGIDLTGFSHRADLPARIRWARDHGLAVDACYLRYSTRFQDSDVDQLRVNLEVAANAAVYIPPEFCSSDKAISGKRDRRAGLNRLRKIMESGHIKVIFLFALSRLYRKAYRAMQFLNEEVVECGLRAIVVSQAIDTADEKSWKLKLQFHSMMDEMQTEASAAHGRAGLIGLFRQGFVTGRIPIWCRAVEVPDAPPTKLGKPRTAPALIAHAVELIRKHAKLHLAGMSLKEGRRRWIEQRGPCPPESRNGRISAAAYRRIWSNVRLKGLWEFGRTKSQYISKVDYTKQVPQPEELVITLQIEELRVISDEELDALQGWLAGLKTGPHGPRSKKSIQLCDLTTEFFFCAACSANAQDQQPVRYYQTGAHGLGMQCKNGDFCPAKSAVRREDAVRAVCESIADIIVQDKQLLVAAATRAEQLDQSSDDDLRAEIDSLQKQIRNLSQRIDALYDLAGVEHGGDRKETLARIRNTKAERSMLQTEVNQKRHQLEHCIRPLTCKAALAILDEFQTVLRQAASGELGEDAVYQALAIFRDMTGGKIMVHVESRPKRKQTNVRGVFRHQVLQALKKQAGHPGLASEELNNEVWTWLREPPLVDRLAPRVYELVIVQGLSLRAAARQLQREGYKVNSGNVYTMLRRYFEMIGEPMPKLPYNNGHPRSAE